MTYHYSPEVATYFLQLCNVWVEIESSPATDAIATQIFESYNLSDAQTMQKLWQNEYNILYAIQALNPSSPDYQTNLDNLQNSLSQNELEMKNYGFSAYPPGFVSSTEMQFSDNILVNDSSDLINHFAVSANLVNQYTTDCQKYNGNYNGFMAIGGDLNAIYDAIRQNNSILNSIKSCVIL